jgi:hypothetical protein
MKTLRILIPRHYDFTKTHYTEVWMKSLHNELSKHFSISIIWLLYLPKKIIQYNISNNESVEYIQDFNNAIDVVKKLKPDLIISSEYPSLIDLAFYAASENSASFFIKEMLEFNTLEKNSKENVSNSVKLNPTIPFLSALSLLFSTSTMSEVYTKNHSTFSRIKFILYKCKFLFSTLFFSKLTLTKKWNIFSAGLGYMINPPMFYFNPKLYPDIDFCNNSILYNFLIKNNYSHLGLHVVGNPLYDNFFKKRIQLKNENVSEKIQVLFAPTKFARIESNQKQTKESTMMITKAISKYKSEFDFFVKLHPSTQQYEEYEQHIHNLDESVPIFQKGTIESFIERSDVLITFTQITTMFMFPLILRKPVILCNFFGEKLLDEIEKIVFVCTDPSELQNIIHEAINTNYKKYEKIDKYLELSCFKTDGLSSKRIVDHIVSLMNNKSKN